MPLWTRWLSLCLPCLGALLVAQSAAAQSLTIANLEREDRNNPYMLTENQINQADCLAQDTLTFTLALVGVGNQSVQVWEGMACALDTNRDSADDPCTLIFEGDGGNNVIELSVPELLGAVPDTGADGAGGADGVGGADGAGGAGAAGAVDLSVCTPATGDGIEQLQLHFLLVSADMVVGTPPAPQVFDVDLRGPEPPTDLKVSVGDGALIVNFKESTGNAADIAGYNMYCEDCASGTFVPGALPPAGANHCGRVSSMSEQGQTDDDLTNGVETRVGLAAFDKFGNPGTLSQTVCGTPQLVTGFYEAYRAAGGKGGGGGICSLSGPGRLGLGALGASGALILAAALRRLRSPRRRS